MPRAARTCTTCPAVITSGSKCAACTARARAASDRKRRPDGNPYATAGHQRFRAAVLARDPICTVCGHAWSTVADHHPTSRADLIAQGHDPNDPSRGRGVCKRCHDRETAQHQPGGWHASQTVTGWGVTP